MRYELKTRLVVPMTILVISAMLSGCINKEQEQSADIGYSVLSIKYLDNISILANEDFPDFELIDHKYFVTSDSVPITIGNENSHMSRAIDASEEIPNGYRIYGISEVYNSSKNVSKDVNKSLDKNLIDRYILLQYKVFDNSDKLNYLLNMTAAGYVNEGYESRTLNDTNNMTYKERIFILESTNEAGMDRIILLFGYDTIVGRIAVQDSVDRSLNESLKILDIVNDRLKVNSKNMTVSRKDMFKSNISMTT